MNKRNKKMLWILGILLTLIAVKSIWMAVAMQNVGSFETEKKDLLRRRDYLIGKIVTEPKKLIDRINVLNNHNIS